MSKDWTGNGNSIWKTLGASSHTDKERQREDYYATDPKAAELLLLEETFTGPIWECACGEKHLAKVFEERGYAVRSSDLIDRCGNEVFDFLSIENQSWEGDIITNPPYKYALDFIYKALQIVKGGVKWRCFSNYNSSKVRSARRYSMTFLRRWYMSPPHELCAPRMAILS